MNYIKKKVLLENEPGITEVKKSPIFLVLRWLWGILGCWLLFIPTLKAIGATISFCTTEYCVTRKRTIEKHGWLNTSCDETPLEKIENVTINQTVFGKIFNYGDLIIQSANRNNIYFNTISAPEKIRKIINQYRSE